MKSVAGICVFGEVLFDVFPDGEAVLGGAPFNVAWHLQALGNEPLLVTRIGRDLAGKNIRLAMEDWHMSVAGVQEDPVHPSGRVEVSFTAGEPSYKIVADCAYDFIDAEAFPLDTGPRGLLYHGTLALRNEVSRMALEVISGRIQPDVFVDVNLRTPWWHKEQVQIWLKAARWAKLNREELFVLGAGRDDAEDAARDFVRNYELEQLIVTCGGEGAFVCRADGLIERVAPPVTTAVVDTVGAGDAFTAVYLHGLLHGWDISETLHAAQLFASMVVGLRGATSREHNIYQRFFQGVQGL